MVRKCSYQAIQQYKSEINKYLTDKGISDHSKYHVYIKDNRFHFDKWEYGVEQPKDLTIGIQGSPNYKEVHQRMVYLDLSIRPIPQHTTINSRGMLGSDSGNEEIIGMSGLDFEIKNIGYMIDRNQILSSKLRLHNGNLRTNSEIKKSDITINFTGRFRILILYINS